MNRTETIITASCIGLFQVAAPTARSAAEIRMSLTSLPECIEAAVLVGSFVESWPVFLANVSAVRELARVERPQFGL